MAKQKNSIEKIREWLGLVHIYCGDGKGKTTASAGLAVRARGHGLNVLLTQFLKSGTSGAVSYTHLPFIRPAYRQHLWHIRR